MKHPPPTPRNRPHGAFLSLLLVLQAGFSAGLIDSFSKLTVIDEVEVAAEDPGHRFMESPAGSTRLEQAGGRTARVMPPDGPAKYWSVRLGEGKDLVAMGTYLLEVDFAEDAPRTFYILNRGDDTSRGVACGTSLPASINRYTAANLESLPLPVPGGIRTWRSLFRLHDRFFEMKRPLTFNVDYPLNPATGFPVIIAQPEGKRQPGSQGAAVTAIRLRAVPDPALFDLKIPTLPPGLPSRHIFWREEMADGAVSGEAPNRTCYRDPLEWYVSKTLLMKFIGIDTFAKDLLEFGANQGWDSSPHGGNDWVYQSKHPERWEKIVTVMGKAGIPVLPYYEYCGSKGGKGLGNQKRARPLSGKSNYTHVAWVENANADLTDPETLEDFGKVLDCTILRLKDKARFLGAWIRTRPSQLPMGFSESTLERFSRDALGGKAVTRGELAGDATLKAKYEAWWYGKRKDFLVAARDFLSKGGVPDPFILFSPHSSEPAPEIGGGSVVVLGDLEPWKSIVSGDGKTRAVRDLESVLQNDEYLKSSFTPIATWGDFEWNHCAPPADPGRYQGTPGIFIAYPFNRDYTVRSFKAFDAYRTPAGLAAVRHYPLNEKIMNEKELGYFCGDVELAGPHSMRQEALAVAYGDPNMLAALTGMGLVYGFPEYARAFYAAYLSLPALPSQILPGAASDPDVMVRAIPTPRDGTWLALVNTAFGAKIAVKVRIPPGFTKAILATTGENLSIKEGALTLDMEASTLTSIRLLKGDR